MKIDPLYFLLLAEFALIFFVLTLYLFFSNRKLKDMYQKTLRKLNDLKSERSTEAFDSLPPGRAAITEAVSEDLMEPPLPHEVSTEPLEDRQPDAGEGGPPQGKVELLQRMVNFQKSTIVELMCYKDVFEGARKRLASLQEGNNELQEKIRALIEGGIGNEGLAEAAAALEVNNSELEKFMAILDKENVTISEKFQIWEEEFKQVAEEVEKSPDAAVPDDAKYTEILKEKETMVTKVKEFEEKLDEKSKLLSSMQAQYEDLEKEYMILYRQQQQQAQQEQAQS
ncbi:MAG: hypothetical protein ABSB95_07505 [Dissulfurispiraceae bacterium]|jgi:hypothetical protein